MKNAFSRRRFLELSGGLGLLAGLGRLSFTTSAAAAGDYKALVCLFMFGGNDGHNTVIPMEATQYAAYKQQRGGLQLSQNQLLPISDATQGNFGFHYSMTEMQQLYIQGRMAVLANVGTLYQPTSYQQYTTPGFQLPSQLRSHSDQVSQMQTGQPDTSLATGWGGRCVDTMQNAKYQYNAASNFPASIAMNSPAMFCTGNVVAGTSSQPGNFLSQGAMGLYPASSSTARKNAQNTVITTASGNAMIDAANKQLATAAALNPILASAANTVNFNQPFPSTSIGNQLKEIARLISLNSQLNLGRQVFFCSLGAFDTHSGQSYQQQVNLLDVSQALGAFAAATQQLGVDQNVTTFTLSDFGRTLQPSGSGSDHGWGNHHFIMGGAVQGGKMYGRYPLMTNLANFNNTADDFADNRGVMLPSTGLAQYGATLAKWFGVQDDTELDELFPTLTNFTGAKNLGFV